jgi:hypothetical protein
MLKEIQVQSNLVQKRNVPPQFLKIVLLDVLSVPGFLLSVVSVVHVPLWWLFYEEKKAWIERTIAAGVIEHRYIVTFSFHSASLRCLWLIIKDLFALFQVLVIFLGIFHVPDLFTSLRDLRRQLQRPEAKPFLLHNQEIPDRMNSSPGFDVWFYRGVQQLRWELDTNYVTYYPMSFYRPRLHSCFLDSVRHFPHVMMLPLKVLGLPLIPILQACRGYVETPSSSDSLHHTQLMACIKFLLKICVDSATFWGVQWALVFFVVAVIVLIPHELALLATSNPLSLFCFLILQR